jgi:hypothetical protein
MRYLGNFSGDGLLKRDGAEDARVGYNFDLYSRPVVGRTASGEITAAADILRRAFEGRDFRVQIEDGTSFDLRFEEKTLEPGCVVARVVSGGKTTSNRHA